ncbi:ribosomal protein S5 domain 2-type protein [Scheffersomyces xylosifermentans]|uniref:ribosomal protein S5 domain 2-type protein n=1 Tax=Scheffersomyces xylosifermentans TaxID=1304137 RepID=UPI00315D3C93
MSKNIEVSTNEKTYFLEALKSGIRLDSRAFDEIRQPEITLSKKEYGYVELDWGTTKLAVRVSAEIRKPYEDRPFEGLFMINCEISSMSWPHFDNQKNSNDEVLIARIIEKAIRRSNSLDLESLCIIAGEKVWCITVDLNFLNYDGNFIDAGCFGVMLALHHFKKPDISIVNGGEDIIVHDVNERQPVPLSVLHVPVCLTYSFYNPGNKESNLKGEDDDEIYLLDANLLEEQNREGSIVITLNKNRELIQLSKNGGIPINANVLLELSFKSMKIVDRLTEKIKEVIKKHEAERYEELNLRLLEVGADR